MLFLYYQTKPCCQVHDPLMSYDTLVPSPRIYWMDIGSYPDLNIRAWSKRDILPEGTAGRDKTSDKIHLQGSSIPGWCALKNILLR